MKERLSGLYLLLLLFVIPGCKKSAQSNDTDVSIEQLLTGKTWRLVSYGQDSNNNGLVDPAEEAIQNCEKDNTYSFRPGGTGIIKENTELCPGNVPETVFQWALINNNRSLDFMSGLANVLRLNSDSMVLGDSNEGSGKLLFIYQH